MQLYIPKTGNFFSIHVEKNHKSISFLFPMFRYSTTSGLMWRTPRIHPKMTAMKRFFELVALDQVPRVVCPKCIRYPLEFHNSIRAGDELQYSGYERTIIDKILRRN